MEPREEKRFGSYPGAISFGGRAPPLTSSGLAKVKEWGMANSRMRNLQESGFELCSFCASEEKMFRSCEKQKGRQRKGVVETESIHQCAMGPF